MRLKTTLLLSLTLALTVSLGSAAPASAGTWSAGKRLCTHTNPEIRETSGLSRSTYKRKVLFLHNDSGDTARFFAVSRSCKTLGVFKVRGITARDWEDMASGPKHTLWFGDIGDNGESRATISVVKVNEPKLLHNKTINKSTRYELAYPDGAHNAEGMMIRPKNGRLYVVTKSRVAGAIYRAPEVLRADRVNVMEKIADAPTGMSGADFARKGGRFILRGYNNFFVYNKMGAEPVRVPVPKGHTFGEAVTWSRNSRTVILGGEGVGTALWKITES